jgi:hypothetical protein
MQETELFKVENPTIEFNAFKASEEPTWIKRHLYKIVGSAFITAESVALGSAQPEVVIYNASAVGVAAGIGAVADITAEYFRRNKDIEFFE